MKTYFIHTFGCSMNQADSEKIHMLFLQSWLKKVLTWQDADLVIFNTCSVREKWEDRVFWMLQEVYKYNTLHNSHIVTWLTWCMVRKTGVASKYLDPTEKREAAKKIEYLESEQSILNNDDRLFPRSNNKLDFTVRIEEIKFIPHILTHITGKKIWNDDKFDDYLKSKQLRENPSSAQVIIQSWCDNYCSFCIVPYTRWKEISRKHEEIITECREAAEQWAKEITLIGQNVNSYWKQFVEKKLWNSEKSNWNNLDWQSPFRLLLNDINVIAWIDRIRFTSSNPHDMTQDILDSHLDLEHNCNYLHFALQSWSNAMLKKMNRKHTYEEFREKVKYLRWRDPLFSISTDIIVGYSGETDEMFQETIRAFQECEFDFCFTARYSVRKDTLASKIYPDDISNEIKAERWHILNNLLLENITKRNTLLLWRKEEILIAWIKDDCFFGGTRNFKEVFFEKNDKNKVWDIVTVEITELDRYVLHGKHV